MKAEAQIADGITITEEYEESDLTNDTAISSLRQSRLTLTLQMTGPSQVVPREDSDDWKMRQLLAFRHRLDQIILGRRIL